MHEGIEGREETMTRGKHRERKTERLREREIRRESWGRGGREGREGEATTYMYHHLN